jgi:hypothetical protein
LALFTLKRDILWHLSILEEPEFLKSRVDSPDLAFVLEGSQLVRSTFHRILTIGDNDLSDSDQRTIALSHEDSSDEPSNDVDLLKMGSGHLEVIGETIAKIRFFENGINSYSRFLDRDRVDFVIRVPRPGGVIFKEIQVKYSKYYLQRTRGKEIPHAWVKVAETKLRFDPVLNYLFVVGYEKPILFIIPSLSLKEMLPLVRVSSSKKGRIFHFDMYEFAPGRWGIYKRESERVGIGYFDPDNYVDLSDYTNNFEILRR